MTLTLVTDKGCPPGRVFRLRFSMAVFRGQERFAGMATSPFQDPSEAFRHTYPVGSTWNWKMVSLDLVLVLRNTSEQFRNNKGRTGGKTMYQARTEGKANHQDSELPMNSGTRGRRFKSSQARHLFNHLHARPATLLPYCGDFCGDPTAGS
jgi:hypothetical protein